ncbi:MAG: hypothetical protein FWG70_03160 [Oscillospiraceae bacterium]|nr:hypothetical protein [Oscillospiraceae bacterium]
MQAQAYEGYFKNGNFFAAGRTIKIPDDRRIYITILDEPVRNEATEQRLTALDDFFTAIEASDEVVPEFERVKFREVDI